jgi:hypothetical protein
MDIDKAIQKLELSPPFSLIDLKRNYHRLSLKLHPDKNNSPNATSDFQELNDAYECLKDNIDYCSKMKSESHRVDIDIDIDEDFDVFEILNNFTSKINGKKIDKSIILNIIEKITSNSVIVCKELFEGMDKQMSTDLFEYLKKYADVFNISIDTLNKIGDIINDKYKNDEIIKLHPNINNLLNDEIYKLEFNETTYYIPLWHHEVIYDLINKNQLIINIIPELEHHISIDDYNNIHIHLTKSIKGLISSKSIIFNLGKKVFNIPCNELYIKRKQKYVYKKQGISKIDTNNVYDVSKKGDIVVHLTLMDVE